MTWRADAACRGTDLAVWFPPQGAVYRRARAICEACPVREACLEEALALPGERDYGFRAGTTRQQRAVIRQDQEVLWESICPPSKRRKAKDKLE